MIDSAPRTLHAMSTPRRDKAIVGRHGDVHARRRTLAVTAALVAAIAAIAAAVLINRAPGAAADLGSVDLPDSSQISGAFQDPTPVYRLPTAVIVAKRLTPEEVAAIRAQDRRDAALSNNEYGAEAGGRDLRR